MPVAALIPHPSTPCEWVRALTVELQWLHASALHLVFRLQGDIGRLRIPSPRKPQRADELWRHTCFEIFLRTPGMPAYAEFNFAPSGEWAAYRFTGYRSGMAVIDRIGAPTILCRQNAQSLELDVQLELPEAALGQVQAAVSAVLEDHQDGISYWALTHPQARADFHDAAGFTLSL